MAYVTRKGTQVLHPDAVRMAIIEEAYHGDDVAEYEVYRRFSVRGEAFAEEGDKLMLRNSDDHERLGLGAYAWTCNLTNGLTKHVSWDTLANCVRPKAG